MRLCKGGIVGIEQLLEGATGHGVKLPRSLWVMYRLVLRPGRALPGPSASPSVSALTLRSYLY